MVVRNEMTGFEKVLTASNLVKFALLAIYGQSAFKLRHLVCLTV